MRTGSVLLPVGGAFSLFGFFWGGWAVAAADVERQMHVSHAAFGLILSAGLVGAAAAQATGGALAERLGTARMLAGSLLAWATLLGLGAVASPAVLLGVAVVCVTAAAGLIDVVMNVAATAALASTPGRLVRFHGLFNVGAAVGAGTVGLLLASGTSWRLAWAAAALAALALAAWCRRADLPGGDPGEAMAARRFLAVLRRERLGMLAAAFAVSAMVEGGVELWGVLYLRTRLPSGLLVGTAGAVSGYLVAAAARIGAGPGMGRRLPRLGVTAGAGLAAVGVMVLVTAGPSALKAAGLVAAAGGISMCWPLLLAAAGSGRSRPGVVVGAVSTVGYSGLVIGPALVGAVAGRWGLKTGLVVLAAAAAFVAGTPLIRILHEGEKR